MNKADSGPKTFPERLALLAPYFIIIPIVLYTFGYLTAYGFYGYYGGLWLLPEVSHIRLLELSVYPATSACIVAVIFGIITNRGDRRWSFAWWIVAGLIYIYGTGLILVALGIMPYSRQFEKNFWMAEVLLSSWCVIPASILWSLHLKRAMGLHRITIGISILVILFGCVVIIPLYGRSIAISLKDSPKDRLVWKDKETGDLETKEILLVRGDTYYVVDRIELQVNPISESEALKAVGEFVKNVGGEPPYFYPHRVQIIKDTDVVEILPAGSEKLVVIPPAGKILSPAKLERVKPKLMDIPDGSTILPKS